jgi:hypothetical protein
MISYLEWNNNILFNCEKLTDTTGCSINNNKDCDYKTCPKINELN